MYNKNNNLWEIYNLLIGSGGFIQHFELFFHFAPHISVERVYNVVIGKCSMLFHNLFSEHEKIYDDLNSHFYIVKTHNLALQFIVSSNNDINSYIEQGCVSYAYGLKEEAQILVVSSKGACPSYFYTIITDKNETY